MRVLFYHHKLLIGGSIINAVNLAGTLRRRGHQVTFVAEDGDMRGLVDSHGLEFVPLDYYKYPHPSRKIIKRLKEIIRAHDPDIIHNWEDSTQGLIEIVIAAQLGAKKPLLNTYMGNHIFKEFHYPQCALITIGVPSLAEEALTVHKWDPKLLNIWNARIDLAQAQVDPKTVVEFRHTYGLDNALVVLTTVRLEYSFNWHYMKTLFAAFEPIAREFPGAVLLVAGDGPAMEEAQGIAAKINDASQRRAVILAGWVKENHVAYTASDIVAGQGSSLLWAMAHGKPAVTVGKNGWSAVLEPGQIEILEFMHFYSYQAVKRPVERLEEILRCLLSSPRLRSDLAAFGREYVKKFSLETGAAQMEEIYEQTIAKRIPPSKTYSELVRAYYCLEKFRAWRRLQRVVFPGRPALKPLVKNYLVFPRES